ncbi:MAG: hypothetical protein AB7H80_05625, partial [Candidatus Kapaibacterium sp.]
VDLLPSALQPLGVVLTFDVLYNAEVFTRDSDERGGNWGVHFNYRERRQAHVKLHMHGYLAIEERYFRNTQGKSQVQHVYLITMDGFNLLTKLKHIAGIE